MGNVKFKDNQYQKSFEICFSKEKIADFLKQAAAGENKHLASVAENYLKERFNITIEKDNKITGKSFSFFQAKIREGQNTEEKIQKPDLAPSGW